MQEGIQLLYQVNSIVTSESIKRKISMLKVYNNPTGPGDYDNTPSLGRKGINSLRRNQPSYSFGTEPGLIQVKGKHSPKQIQKYFVSDGPSPLTYSPERSNKIMTKSPQKWSIPREKRFYRFQLSESSDKP